MINLYLEALARPLDEEGTEGPYKHRPQLLTRSAGVVHWRLAWTGWQPRLVQPEGSLIPTLEFLDFGCRVHPVQHPAAASAFLEFGGCQARG